MSKKDETLTITMIHCDGNGDIFSTLELVYPTLDNNSANLMQIDLVRALTDVVEQWNKSKQSY